MLNDLFTSLSLFFPLVLCWVKRLRVTNGKGKEQFQAVSDHQS